MARVDRGTRITRLSIFICDDIIMPFLKKIVLLVYYDLFKFLFYIVLGVCVVLGFILYLGVCASF